MSGPAIRPIPAISQCSHIPRQLLRNAHKAVLHNPGNVVHFIRLACVRAKCTSIAQLVCKDAESAAAQIAIASVDPWPCAAAYPWCHPLWGGGSFTLYRFIKSPMRRKDKSQMCNILNPQIGWWWQVYETVTLNSCISQYTLLMMRRRLRAIERLSD